MRKKTIVTIGGGTGSFVVLSGLRNFADKYNFELKAIVSMADDGGSTGRLRDELGVLPPGDIRQCLVALSESPLILRKLLNYRFASGRLRGHSFGNILLSALEKVTGSFDQAVIEASKVFKIKGEVIPVTLDRIRLRAELNDGKIVYGEDNLNNSKLVKRIGIKKIYLSHVPKANPRAIHALKNANLIILGPGNLYCSLIPNLLVKGIVQALISSKAKKVLICNLMNKIGHTDNFFIDDYLRIIENYTKPGLFDYFVYNTKIPSAKLLSKYKKEGYPPKIRKGIKWSKTVLKGYNLLNEKIYSQPKNDFLNRSLIRHGPTKLARVLIKFLS